MPWDNSPAKRQQDAKTYSDPVYRRNRAVAVRRAAGRCEKCGHRHKTQCDHVIPVSQGGTHSADNLQMLCSGDGTCKCHEAKTAQEGGGFRRDGGSRTPRDPKPTPRTRW